MEFCRRTNSLEGFKIIASTSLDRVTSPTPSNAGAREIGRELFAQGRPRARALGAGVVGRPPDGPDPGRPRGQGPALPVHRRDAGPARPRRRSAGTWPSTWTRPATASPGGSARRSRSPRRGRPAPACLAGARPVRRRPTWRSRFIAGATPGEALQTVLKLRAPADRASPPTCWARRSSARPRPSAYQQTCLDLLRGLAGPLAAEPEIPQIDRDDRGPIPRVNLSLKLTSLTARFDALHAEATTERVAARLRPILRTARELGAYVHVDMEQYAHKDLTLAIFRSVLSEPEFRDWPDVGIVAQAYLPETEADLRRSGRLGPRAAARRSRSGWSRGPTGITRSCSPGSSAGRSRSIEREVGRPTPATSGAPGS